jgi:hypothetical protein
MHSYRTSTRQHVEEVGLGANKSVLTGTLSASFASGLTPSCETNSHVCASSEKSLGHITKTPSRLVYETICLVPGTITCMIGVVLRSPD